MFLYRSKTVIIYKKGSLFKEYNIKVINGYYDNLYQIELDGKFISGNMEEFISKLLKYHDIDYKKVKFYINGQFITKQN